MSKPIDLYSISFNKPNDDGRIYNTFNKVLEHSIERNTKSINHTIEINDWPTEYLKDHHSELLGNPNVNAYKLKKWIDFIKQSNSDKIIFSDCDMMFLDDIDEVYDRDFHIGMTKYTITKNNKWPYNGGIIFVKRNDLTDEFFDLFYNVNLELINNPTKHRYYQHRYDGMNQAAMGCILEEHNKNNKFNIALDIPNAIYNSCENDWPTLNPYETKVIHYKVYLRLLIIHKLVYNNDDIYNTNTSLKRRKNDPCLKFLENLWFLYFNDCMSGTISREAEDKLKADFYNNHVLNKRK